MLKGTLDDFTLPDIFRLLSMAKRTGTLAVTRSAGSGRVFFRTGDVYFAESSITREPLGQKLIRARAITEGQLMKALDEHARAGRLGGTQEQTGRLGGTQEQTGRLGGTQEQTGGRRVGEILVASEIVSLEQLETAVREQIEDSVFDLLRWELGDFEWEPGVEADVEVPIAVSVENLIMEASRRLDELEVIKRKIPGVDAVLRMAPKPPEGAVEINITPEEWRILVLVDGSRSVAAIAESVSLDEFGAMRVLYGLVSAGLIELSGAASMDDATVDVDVQVDEVDMDEAPVDEPVADEPVETSAFSLSVDLSPHPNGDVGAQGDDAPPPPPALDEVGAGAFDDVSGAAPAFVSDDLSDELPASLISELSSGDDAIDLLNDTDIPVEAFDAPGPDELTTDRPVRVEEQEPPAVQAAAESDETSPSAPAEEPPAAEPATIDRAAVVRELAGLFNDEDRPRPQRAQVGPDGPPAVPQRVEDDDQITKGLISRLIDGVKGL